MKNTEQASCLTKLKEGEMVRVRYKNCPKEIQLEMLPTQSAYPAGRKSNDPDSHVTSKHK